jgi:hypothetical protein
MKSIVIYLIAESVAIISVVIAGMLAYGDKSGWGWFLVIAVATTVSGYTSKKDVYK